MPTQTSPPVRQQPMEAYAQQSSDKESSTTALKSMATTKRPTIGRLFFHCPALVSTPHNRIVFCERQRGLPVSFTNGRQDGTSCRQARASGSSNFSLAPGKGITLLIRRRETLVVSHSSNKKNLSHQRDPRQHAGIHQLRAPEEQQRQ